jgi:hypothetical protein
LNAILNKGLASRNAAPSTTTSAPATGAAVSSAPTTATDFEAMVYQSQMQKTSLSLQYSQAAAQMSADGTTATASSRQLEFSFAAESRTEQLALFNQRTTTTAEGMSQTQQTQFLAMSRSMSVRFKVSISMSAESLQSYSNTADALKTTGDPSLDKFLALTQKMFGKDDDTLKDLMKFLERMVSGNPSADEKMDKLLDDLSKLAQAKKGGQQAEGATAQAQTFQLEFEFSFESSEMRIEQVRVQQADPLVLDLDDDGIELTDHTQGAQFDIRGSGVGVRTAFVNGGDAFLALDRNGNGRIDNGTELFGDQNGAANGFEELRSFDTNSDGVINASDADFDKLQLFRDDGDGISETGELMSLADAGIAEISLNYANTNTAASGGNRLAQTALYKRHDGTFGKAADVLLNFVA